MKIIVMIAFFLYSIVNVAHAASADKGTAAEAVALVKKTIASLKDKGLKKTIDDVNDKKYNDRDLYVAILKLDGTNLATGVNPRLVGKNLMDMKDADGKSFIKEGIDGLKQKDNGWIDFKWPNPVTKEIELKSTYGERFEDLVVICGIYKGK